MTSIGVSLDVENHEPRQDALRFPSYNYHYPDFKKQQVCDRIDSVCSKASPIFRSTSTDFKIRDCECAQLANVAPVGTVKRDQRAMRWLCVEGGRTEPPTSLPPLAVPAQPKPDLLVGPKLIPMEKLRWAFDSTPVVTTKARNEWNDFLSRCPERFDIQLPLETRSSNKPYFDGGYALRFLRPDLTKGRAPSSFSYRHFEKVPTPSDISPFRSIRSSTRLIGQ